jgi:hypothetical protein
VLRATLVTPLSGKLARFGRESATALTLWAGHGGAAGAVTGVDLEVLDADPDPGAATRAVVEIRPDVLFGPGGSSPSLAIARRHGASLAPPRPPVSRTTRDCMVLVVGGSVDLPEAKARSVRRSAWRRRTYDPLPL